MPGPGSYSLSTGVSLGHSAEFFEETTLGTFPTNPAMKWVGSDLTYSDTPDLKTIQLNKFGNEDLAYILAGDQTYTVSLDYVPQDSTFLKYLVNSQGGGTGTIDKSLSFLISPKINNVQNYLQVLGMKPDSGSIKWVHGKEIRVAMTLMSKSIPAYVTTDPTGTGSHASDPGTNPWIFTDPGSGGLTWNAIAYDFIDATVNFKRNLKDVRVVGSPTLQYLVPMNRGISGNFTIPLEDTAVYDTDFLGNNPRTLVLPLKAGVSTLTLSNAVLTKLARKITIKDVIYETWDWTATTATLT